MEQQKTTSTRDGSLRLSYGDGNYQGKAPMFRLRSQKTIRLQVAGLLCR